MTNQKNGDPPMSAISKRVVRLQQARTPAKNLRRMQAAARGYPAGTQHYAVPGLSPLGAKQIRIKKFVKPTEPHLVVGSDLHFSKRITPVTPGQRGSWQDVSPKKFQHRLSPVKRTIPKRKDWTIGKHGMRPH